MSRWSRRETLYALTWNSSPVSVFAASEALFAVFYFTDFELCLPDLGDKKSAEDRVKELEDTLAKQRVESKKALDDAKDSAALREKEYAERLASLTRDVGG